MPMNNGFKWRPNDNGALTNLRYNLEAEKWVNAVRGAERTLPTGNFGGDLNFIGNLIQLPLLLVFLILMIPIGLIRVIFNYHIKLFPGDAPSGKIRKGAYESVDEFKARLNAIHEEHKGKGRKRKKQWEDLTAEEQRLVQMVREETAKAKANLK